MDRSNGGQSESTGKGRILHWVVVVAFFVMFGTGLILFVPISALAEGGLVLIVHRAAAIVLVGVPLIYALTHLGTARQWLKESMFWTKRASRQPNRWKRLHKFLIVTGFVVFTTTGLMNWLLKTMDLEDVFYVSILVHDIVFILAVCVLLYHVYFELDWWLWKRRYCRSCNSVSCVATCPTKAMVGLPDGIVEYHPERCNSCRLCMDYCRRNSSYVKLDQAVETDATSS
jgi:ferredoxin